MDEHQSYSLVELLRQNIISAIEQTRAPNSKTWRVVVVDKSSLKVISNVLNTHSILEHNVMAIQLISKTRQPYPAMDAIYILAPNAYSVSQVINDFTDIDTDSTTSGEKRQLKYANAHLLFTGSLTDGLFSKICKSPAAVYVKGIKELFLEFNPIETRVFLTTPSQNPLYTLYSPHSGRMLDHDLDSAANRVLSAIVSLDIQPYIRYYRPGLGDANNTRSVHVAESMAKHLQQKLDEHYAHEKHKAEKCPQPQQKPKKGVKPSVVIVLDRTVDLYAPLVHEFTYQAMVHDLVDLEGGGKYSRAIVASNGETQTIEAELTQSKDLLWAELRHFHIAHVAEILSERMGKLIRDNVGVKAMGNKDKKANLYELRAALSELPEFQKLHSAYSLHIDLVSKCLEIAQNNKLDMISEFELGLLTGKTENGEILDTTYIERHLIAMLDDDSLRNTDKMRLLLLYLIHVDGGLESDRRRLEEVPESLTLEDKRAAINLQHLGVPTKKEELSADKNIHQRYTWDGTHSSIRNGNADWLRDSMAPVVKSIIHEHLAGDLDEDMFPWLGDRRPEHIPKHIFSTNAVSLRRNKSKWGEKRQGHPNKDVRHGDKKGPLIVYVAGGATLSELRTIYEMARKYKRDIYLGSTHIITPRGFLGQLKTLHHKNLM